MGRPARRRLDDRLTRLAAQFDPVAEPDPDPAAEARAERARDWCQRADAVLSPKHRTVLAGWLAGLAEAVGLDDGDDRLDGLLRPGAELLLRVHSGVEPSDQVIEEIAASVAR